jgi:rSAM/selenodomain-associated transferase 2
MKFSVIIPTLNEEENIRDTIRKVYDLNPDAEIIVADGRSEDNTARIAHEENAIVIDSRRGRGPQCNAGVANASGNILLFLHSDTILPQDAFKILKKSFQDENVQIGTFRVVFEPKHWLLDITAYFLRFDSVITRFGDQCIVVRKSFFDDMGGFPDWPLFEDTQILRVARRRTRIHFFPGTVITSSRRFVEKGVMTQLLRNLWYMFLYLVGVDPRELARRYEGDQGSRRAKSGNSTDLSA